jgi:hypothetical protein
MLIKTEQNNRKNNGNNIVTSMTERVERKTEKKIVTNLTEKNGKIESNMIA